MCNAAVDKRLSCGGPAILFDAGRPQDSVWLRDPHNLATLPFVIHEATDCPVREARLSGSETEIETAGLAAGLYFWVVQRNGRVWQRGRVGKF